MARRTTPPFRAEHVGSLLRPQSVLTARDDFHHGRIGASELRKIEDDAIRAVVKLQDEVGLQCATDGEFRRASWHMDFLYQLGGVTKARDNLTVRFHNEKGDIEFTPAALHVGGKLKFERCIFGDDFRFLKSATRVTPKLSIPSPSMIHYRGGRAAIDESIYPDIEEFWHDLAAAYADQIASLGALGCTYLQLDDTSLAYLNDPTQREYIQNLGGDGARQHLTYIKTLNAALVKRPPGMTICTHSCRGNFRSSWVASGGYDYVAEALFGELNVDAFFLEYDDARSGGFAPLRFVPKNKMVVLGLVSTKRGALETKEELKRRVDEAARYVPLEQLCLSPQCGFSSTVEGNRLSVDEEIAKLRLVVETAREIWG
ncbi:MAG TPA: 5-methyltetrahydropteroyltriglutamate--homocysteine S-methyltransferase [Candidatus Binataceae bacterium]|nr:5-methyltetrahydropteroyltriglutamate--homocysteine S-methyltransferase [Candidatus Binataceae bacterium]